MRYIFQKGRGLRLLALILAFLLIMPLMPERAHAKEHSKTELGLLNTLDGIARVYLKTLGFRTSLTMKVNGKYSIGGSLAIEPGTYTLTVENDLLTLVYPNGTKRALGDLFTLKEHKNSVVNTITISNPEYGTVNYPENLRFIRSGSGFYVYNDVYIETYLQGVVPFETYDTWPLDAVKVQAIAARSFALNEMSWRAAYNSDLNDTDESQVYHGYPDESAYANTFRAVRETAKQVLTYNGYLISAYYSSTNGGYTESESYMWGGENTDCYGIKEDPYDLANTSSRVNIISLPKTINSTTPLDSKMAAYIKTCLVPALEDGGYSTAASDITLKGITSAAHDATRYRTGYGIGKNDVISNLNVKVTAKKADGSGTAAVTLPCVITLQGVIDAYGITSQRRLMTVSETDTAFELMLGRQGHGVGLSQWGSYTMAMRGKTYQDIIDYYFDGAAISTRSYAKTSLTDWPYLNLQPPSGIKASASGPNSINLTWSKADNANGYIIYGKPSGGSWKKLATTKSLSYSHTGLKSSTIYYYKIWTYANSQYGYVYSEPSDPVSGKTDPYPSPDAPTGVSASALSSGSIRLKWSAVSGVDGYVVYSKPSGGTWAKVAVIPETSCVFTDLVPSTTYYYKVYSYKKYPDAYAYSAASAAASARTNDYIVPAVPQNVTAKPVSQFAINLSWSAAANAEGYVIYKRVSGGTWKKLNTTKNTSYKSMSLKPDTGYEYRIYSYRRDGDNYVYSAGSSVAKIKTPQDVSVPQNVTAKAVSQFAVQLSWDAVSGADGYVIYKRESGGIWKKLNKTARTSYKSQALTPYTDYEYRIYAYRRDSGIYVYSAGSKVAKTKTLKDIAAPQNVTAKPVSQFAIQLGWDAVSGADGYVIYKRVSGGTWKKLNTTKNTSYKSQALQPFTEYEYRIYAYRRDSGVYVYSAGSTVVKAKTLKNVAVPQNVTAKAVSQFAIQLGWDAVSDVDGYVIYKRVSGGTWKKLNTTKNTSYKSQALTPLTTYEYRIYAYRKDDGTYVYSAGSTVAKAKTLQDVAVPSDVAAEMKSSSAITVSWSAAQNAAGYELYKRKAGGSWSAPIIVTATKYDDTGLNDDTVYEYRVRGFAVVGDITVYGKYSPVVSARTLPIVPAPQNVVAAKFSSTAINISWDKVDMAEGYEIYQKQPDGSWEKIASTSSITYKNTGLTPDTEYQYKVKAYLNTQGVCVYSKESAVVSQTTLPVMPAPTGLKATMRDPDSISISWNPVERMSGYVLYRRIPGGLWSKVDYITGTSYINKGLNPGTTYEFKVQSFIFTDGSFFYGSTSGVASAATDSADMAAPANVKATADSITRISLSWDKTAKAVGYVIYSREKGGSWARLCSTKSLSYKCSELKPNTNYEFKVYAYLVAGGTYYYSPASSAVSVKTNAPVVPAAPSNVKAEAESSKVIKLSWDKVPEAIGYVIYKRESSGTWARLNSTLSTSYRCMYLKADTSYDFKVYAFWCEDGLYYYSPASSTVTAKTNK